MLNHLLSLCLLTLLSSGQNYIANVTDIGVGVMGVSSDRVVHLNFSSANPFQLDYGKQEDLISFLYNAGSNFTHVRCHDLVCEDHTKTVIHENFCGDVSCPAEFCTGNPYVPTSSQTFVYSSRTTGRIYATVCNGTVCGDMVSKAVTSEFTGSLGCTLDNEGRVLFSAASENYVSNELLRCRNGCNTIERYFQDDQGLRISRAELVFVRDHPGRPVLVFMRRYTGELYFATSDDIEGVCRCAMSVFLVNGMGNQPFAVTTRKYLGQQWLQVGYMKWKDGQGWLYLLSCRMGVIACLEVHDNVIDDIPYGAAVPSMSYNSQGNLIIGYARGATQHIWDVKMAYCRDFTCSQVSLSTYPQGGSSISRLSIAVNQGTDDVYALFNAGSRIKFLSLFRFDTPSPTRDPTLRPTRKPTGSPTVAVPTISPVPDPTLSPSPAPTMVTETPTDVPTGVPTEQPTESPTPCFDPNAEGVEDEGEKLCASKLTLGWVINGFFFLGNAIVFSCIFDCMARCMSYCKPQSANHAIEDGIVSIE